jgi:methylmalonyl-CoA mutase N-terminal domain/subunit
VNKYEEGVKGSRNQGVQCEDDGKPGLKLLKVDPELGKRRAAELTQYKQTRDGAQVKQALVRVSETAATAANLMVPIVSAVRLGCTVGEISDALRGVFGEYDRLR